jgi:hypothetical protein
MKKKYKQKKEYFKKSFVFCIACASLCSVSVLALGEKERPKTSVLKLMEEVIVTARKRGAEESRDLPVSVTGFGEAQLESINFKDIGSLGYTMPNVSLDENGVGLGFSNFSIRGLGINSSSPSIDPTVGVFIDGVYFNGQL